MGVRDTEDRHDTLYISGFTTGCSATRTRKSSLIVPGDLLVADWVSSGALHVLNAVVSSAIGAGAAVDRPPPRR